ncbi:MAG: Holliday junction ATP-dependent DNA helicase RuvB [Syntrophus sp. SKADARSKE-3]|nr:Holliday junction ATP-dependent DNA helicase RuvB [Syntrophus sp. SKADARSKE-3]
MSDYLVIARKWRPQTFEDVVGQEHVVKTLRNAISLNRIAHSFIFSGPRGIGKTSIARILAKALNCEKGPTQAPCQICPNCREITEGISLDVQEIDGASNRGIDEVRELRENVRFQPVSSRYKVYIIDEVHMLTREAFNALLKTLEEPPPHVIFVFATTETQKIPATIMSRCQCFDFHRISLKHIAQNLRKIADAEGIRISDAGLMWIAEAGDGSMRDSESIFDQVISYAGLDIADQDVESILGRSDRRFLFQTSAAVFKGDAAQCLRIIDEAYYAGLDMLSFFQMLLQHFRNLLFIKIIGPHEDMLQIGGDDLEKMKEQTADLSRDTLQRYLDVLMDEEDSLRRSRHTRLNLEATLVRMAYLEPLIPIDQIMSRMEGLEKRLSSGPSEPAKPKAASSQMTYASTQKEEHPSPVHETKKSAYETIVPSDDQRPNDIPSQEGNEQQLPQMGSPLAGQEDALWDGFKIHVKKASYPLWSRIDHGKVIALENNVLRISCTGKDYNLFIATMDVPQKETLQAQARVFFKNELIVLRFEPNGLEQEPTDKVQNGPSRTNRLMESKREVMNHPALQKILDVFEGAEVKEVVSRKSAGETRKQDV